MPPIQLLSTDCVMLREYALQMLLKEAKKEMHPLIIDASEYCNTEKLLTHFRNHWKLLIPVSLTGFRFELEDFLNAYRKKIKKGILIVTQANRLPIATQAALMHLVYLQFVCQHYDHSYKFCGHHSSYKNNHVVSHHS
jgi:hypothetical protein